LGIFGCGGVNRSEQAAFLRRKSRFTLLVRLLQDLPAFLLLLVERMRWSHPPECEGKWPAKPGERSDCRWFPSLLSVFLQATLPSWLVKHFPHRTGRQLARALAGRRFPFVSIVVYW